MGEWEGLDHATVRSRWPEAFAEGVIDPLMQPPGGESMRQLQDRIAGFLQTLAGQADDNDVYVVSHNGWIRTAMLVNGELSMDRLFAEPVPFPRPIAFELRPERLDGPLPFDES